MGEEIAKWLYKKMEGMKNRPDKILYNDAVRINLKTLEPTVNIAKKQKEYVVKKLSLCSLIVVIGVILSALLWIKEGIETEIVDNRIVRNAYGDGEKTVELSVNDGSNSYNISLDVGEKEYNQKEIEALSKEVITVLEKQILGENRSLDKIEYDMRLVKSIEGYPFTISWCVDEEYIDYEGHLIKDILDKPKLLELTAQFKYDTFELEHKICIMVHSKAIQPDNETVISKNISNEESNSRNKEYMTLPSEIKNMKLKWSYKKSFNGLIFLMATPILAIVVYYGKDRDLNKKVAKREEEMRIDYPEIVSALALLIGAGMTVPNAWKKIATDYSKRKVETNTKRYAYEEMLITVYEMENGVLQTKAYERFGRRCRISSYNKLATLLSQNIRKGASNLPRLLKQEASEAFDERKHMAREMGEKAGTKLLVPMMLLLGMIMIIIMIPAFKNI